MVHTENERPQLGFGTAVSTDDGTEGPSVEHVRSGGRFGEGHLRWRCWECDELGRLEHDLPDTRPSCGTAREVLFYWIDD